MQAGGSAADSPHVKAASQAPVRAERDVVPSRVTDDAGAAAFTTGCREELARATEFSDYPGMCDPLWIVRSLQQHRDIWALAPSGRDVARYLGRRRIKGSWPANMLSVSSPQGACRYRAVLQSVRGTRRSGRPPASRAALTAARSRAASRLRGIGMTELEPYAEDFVKAANSAVFRRAVKHEPRIKEGVTVDATGFETHARLEHCCSNPEACKALGGKPAKFARRANARRGHRAPPRRIRGCRRASTMKRSSTSSRTTAFARDRRGHPYRYWNDSNGLQHQEA